MNKYITSLYVIIVLFLLTIISISATEIQHYAKDQKNIQLLINCTTSDCNEMCRVTLMDPDKYLRMANGRMTTNPNTHQSNITITSYDVLLPKGTYKYNITCTNFKGDKINQIQSYFTVGNSFPTVYVLLGIGAVVIIIFGIIVVKRRMEG